MLPDKPAIENAVLNWEGCCLTSESQGAIRWYPGEIRLGMVFAWEPNLPYARELCVVTGISGPMEPITFNHARGVAVISRSNETTIYTRPLGDLNKEEVWNEESRFREAVVPTIINDMPFTQPSKTAAA